jgi:poly(3-hydroxybutyrate) depolymerase
MRVCICVVMGLLFAAAVPAQTRYKDLVFPEYTVEKDLRYNAGELFDLYQPRGDTNTLRPLIIWMHGGGFKFGSRKASGIRLWCATFSRRGYVCAAIDYPLGGKNLNFRFNELVSNCYRGVQDVRQAIAYFRQNAARWRIDTTRIVLAGNSAGGMLALQTVYSCNAGMENLLGVTDSSSADEVVNPGGVAAVINFWGGIFDTTWLHQASVPIVSVHGARDRIVPYDNMGYSLYGSGLIHKEADALGIPNALKTYERYSHELQKRFNPLVVGSGTRKRWLEAGQFAAGFLYRELGE